MIRKILFVVFFLIALYSANALLSLLSIKSDIANLKNLSSYESADQLFPAVKRIKRNLTVLSPLGPILKKNHEFSSYIELLDTLSEIEPLYKEFFARGTKKKFLILMQNNAELRPTGGFWGSYGIIDVEDGRIKNFETTDTFEIDKELVGKFRAPEEIKDIVEGEWRLWNANWSPDFKAASEQAFFFLDQIKEKQNFDGIIAPNIDFLLALLKISGPVQVEGYNFKVSEDNFTLKMIYEPNSYEIFSPSKNTGSIIKAEEKNIALGKIGRKALESIIASGKQMELSRQVMNSLANKDIFLFSKNAESQKIVEKMDWGGRTTKSKNFVMAIDANFGSKLDFIIDKKISVKEIEQNTYQATIEYKNSYSQKDASSRQIYTTYRDLLRVYLPDSALLKEAIGPNTSATLQKDQETGLVYASFLLVLEPGESANLSITWTVPPSKESLSVIKQPGSKIEIVRAF